MLPKERSIFEKEQGQTGRQFHQWNPTVRGGDQSSGLIQASLACPILTGNHAGILHVFQRSGRNTDLPYHSSCHETDTRQFKGSRKTLKLKYPKSITQELPLLPIETAVQVAILSVRASERACRSIHQLLYGKQAVGKLDPSP